MYPTNTTCTTEFGSGCDDNGYNDNDDNEKRLRGWWSCEFLFKPFKLDLTSEYLQLIVR